MEMKDGAKYKKVLRDFFEADTNKEALIKCLLFAIGLAALPALVFMAAGLGNAAQILGSSPRGRYYSRRQISNGFAYLKHKKLIEYIGEKNGQTIVRITTRGESRLRQFAIESIKLKKPKRWDGKWRAVIFDIPVRFRKIREAFRMRLKALGFFQLQKSVWVHPFPCEDEILFIADFFFVRRYVEILTIESLLHDERLKRKFWKILRI